MFFFIHHTAAACLYIDGDILLYFRLVGYVLWLDAHHQLGLSAFITFNYQFITTPFLRGYNIGNGIMGQQTENKFDRSLKDQNNSVTLI